MKGLPMQLLLRDNVANLGHIGDVVNVKDGYARNYLLPRSLATTVNKGALRALEKVKQQRLIEEAARVEELRAVADKLALLSVEIAALVSDEENLYGSVSAADLATVVAAQGFDLAPEAFLPAEPIKKLGEYQVPVKLHAEVKTAIKVVVTRKEAE
ncbi:50S ribosomal protein L9 [Planctomycetales bacterium]|nr:50S ribosomal protein L9 [Planctomycetales bacterium]